MCALGTDSPRKTASTTPPIYWSTQVSVPNQKHLHLLRQLHFTYQTLFDRSDHSGNGSIYNKNNMKNTRDEI